MRDPRQNQLTSLVREHGARVRRVLARRGVAAAELPDVEQEVFLVAHRKLAEFEGRSSFATWLYGIASNVASQHRRLARHRREQLGLPHEPASDALDPLARLQVIEQAARVQRLLALLPDEQREVLVLRELSELSMHEVARELNVPLKTAFSRLYAAHRALRRALLQERLGAAPVRKAPGRLGALAAFLLGMRWLPRAHALSLAAIAVVCTVVAPVDSRALVLRTGAAEHVSAEHALRTRLPIVLAAAAPDRTVPAAPHIAKRAPRSAEPVLEQAPAAQLVRDLVVIRMDESARGALPYPHPFEERAFTSVDPATIKPRLLHRAAFCPARAPCAL